MRFAVLSEKRRFKTLDSDNGSAISSIGVNREAHWAGESGGPLRGRAASKGANSDSIQTEGSTWADWVSAVSRVVSESCVGPT
jgi:hypothetical protein